MPNTIRHTGLSRTGAAAAAAAGLLSVPAAEASGGSVTTSSASTHRVAMLSDVVTELVAVEALVLS